MTVRHLRFAGLELRIDTPSPAADRSRDPATGPPLLLCSGLGAGLEMFDPLLRALAPEVEIIRWNAPGIGDAPPSLFPQSFPLLAHSLARALDELGHQQVDVLGYSWGGALAQQFALQHATRCRRLVLVSTNTGILSYPGDARVLSSMLIPPGLPIPGAAAAQEELFAGADPARRRDLRTLLTLTRASASSTGYLHQLVAVSSWTSLPLLPWISQPVLVMNGADDPIVPLANAELLTGLIRDATLSVFPGGHGEIITAADVLAPPIARFLAA